MQQIMAHTTDKYIFLQSSEIFKNALVSIRNPEGNRIILKKIRNTNYMSLETKLPTGEYTLIVEEDGKFWKRNIYL